RLVKNVNGGPGDSGISQMTAVGSSLFFTAGDELWKSDGTTAGTVLVKRPQENALIGSGVNNPLTIGNVTYFAATDATHGQELWKTDGTPSGTQMVIDLTGGANSSDIHALNNFNSALVLVANDQLYRSDGTAAGMVSIGDGVGV